MSKPKGVIAAVAFGLTNPRRLEGIASAKARGVYKGKLSIDPAKIK
jgi:hypothetical protein